MPETLHYIMKGYEELYPIMREIPNAQILFSILGAALDQYAADHDMTCEELQAITRNLLEAQKNAHELMGLPEKSR